MSEKEQPKSYVRRDFLIEVEKKVQKKWDEHHAFESNALSCEDPSKSSGKFFCSFPYPYMNGVLHLGHAFSLSKAEFANSYQRLLNKNVLFPFGFHCTGMPICAAALKLQNEIKTYGNPPIFPDNNEVEKISSSEIKEENKKLNIQGRKKGKEMKKKSTQIYQWNIMKEMGIEEKEIPLFVDPIKWLQYFPPIAKTDLQNFGLKADFRRSFITTQVNPYYDKFIKWQFRKLRPCPNEDNDENKVAFGKRMSIFSPLDDQVCADHDRSEGEGINPQEYVIIKQKLLYPYPSSLIEKGLGEDKSIFLCAATLRPETMYGQTNTFVLPDSQYGVYHMNNQEIYICSAHSMKNMSYQEMTVQRGVSDCICMINGQDLIGYKVHAPLCPHPFVYILPLYTIDMNKGTGVVTSVPSDSPDDYIALQDLLKKPKLRQIGILTEEMIPKEVIPIIEIPSFGKTSAQNVCNELNINSQFDKISLEKAKEKVYLKGFYEGIMLVDQYKSMKVNEAKPIVKQNMIDNNQAFLYSEPESLVFSRSGCECVCALTDQWYIKYGQTEWKQIIKTHVENILNTYNPKTKKKFLEAIDWLQYWACSRSFGLGTNLPYESSDQYVIESLSDSTIYMAYYTIVHLIQGPDNLDGSRPGPFNIQPDQLTDEVFDYIFNLGPFPENSSISQEKLKILHNEYLYWYPLDLRVSGKDLITNHLTMCLYNHAAVWPNSPELWPRSFFTNGHVMINNMKMSKSTGNFMTLAQCLKEYGCDSTRIALADAGDTNDDSNYDTNISNASIMRLYNEGKWIQDFYNIRDTLRTSELNLWDKIFLNDINTIIKQTQNAYENMQYKEALKYSWYNLTNLRDQYRLAVGGDMHIDPFTRYVEVQLIIVCPIVPHWSEYFWEVTGHSGLVIQTHWPTINNEDHILTRKADYLRKTAHDIRQSLLSQKKSSQKIIQKLQKKPKPTELEKERIFQLSQPFTSMIICISPQFDQTSVDTLNILREQYDPNINEYKTDIKQLICQTHLKKDIKTVMQISKDCLTRSSLIGIDAFEISLPFDEKSLVDENIEYLIRELGENIPLHQITVCYYSQIDQVKFNTYKFDSAKPGQPVIHFY